MRQIPVMSTNFLWKESQNRFFFKAFIRSIVTIKGMPISSMLWLYRLLFVNDWNAYNWDCAAWLLES